MIAPLIKHVHLAAGAMLSAAFAVILGIMLLSAGGTSDGTYLGPRDTIAFSTDAGSQPGIYLISGDDARHAGVDTFRTYARLIAVQPGDSIYSLAWSPDGSRLLYLVKRPEGTYPRYTFHADLWTVKVDGSGQRRLAPDFVSERVADSYPLFMLVSADAGLDALVLRAATPRDARAPSRSPRGRFIAVRDAGIDSYFICIRKASTPLSTPQNLLDGCFADSIITSYPAWSPR